MWIAEGDGPLLTAAAAVVLGVCFGQPPAGADPSSGPNPPVRTSWSLRHTIEPTWSLRVVVGHYVSAYGESSGSAPVPG